ncbi:NAD(P)H-binding protein [Crossiella sp. CA198]|uniref:NAD(P)H-binding protein n=1 Tax=Crossiella sp. CA198 TaxID=3455607 RepID=UPI003F8D0AD5
MATGAQSDPAALRDALDGVDTVFLVWPVGSTAEAARVVEVIAARARRVVLLSSAAVEDTLDEQSDPIGAHHAGVERLIAGTGLEWTFLRPFSFAANTRQWAGQVRAGDVVRGAHGEAGFTLIHEADIAAVAVRALTEDGHQGARHLLSGPEIHTQREQVRIIGETLGRPLRWQEIPVSQARADALSWLDESIVDTVLDAYATLVTRPLGPTGVVEQVLGRPGRSFREWVAGHAADFGGGSHENT